MTAPTEDRPRCSDGDRRKRAHQVLVRLDADEHADLTRLAADSGRSLPDVLRAGLTYLTAMETR